METRSVLLAGVGGQGAILAAKVLVDGLTHAGFDVKMSEVHGMSQRGGSVTTQVRYGARVYSPFVGLGGADVLVAFEKMEAVRYANFLKPDGVAVINDFEMPSAAIAAGLAEYPRFCIEAMQKRFTWHVLDAASIAGELGAPRCMSIGMQTVSDTNARTGFFSVGALPSCRSCSGWIPPLKVNFFNAHSTFRMQHVF